MGLFSNKPKKMYTLGEAKRMLNQEKYKGYTTVPVETENGTLYQIEKELIVAEKVRNERRESFVNQISGNGAYRRDESPKYVPYSPNKRNEIDFLR